MQSLKSITVSAVKGQLPRTAVVVRSIRMDSKLLGLKKGFPNTKVSATVLNSNLPQDGETELKPEEPRKPADLPAPIVTHRRNEMDQRATRNTQYQEYLKHLLDKQKAKSEERIQCMPFVPAPAAPENPVRKHYDTPEALLEQVSDPMELAKELIRVRRQLSSEKARADLLLHNYLELESSRCTPDHSHPPTSYSMPSIPLSLSQKTSSTSQIPNKTPSTAQIPSKSQTTKTTTPSKAATSTSGTTTTPSNGAN